MDETQGDYSLVEWAFGAFHTAIFIVVLVLFLYLRGALGALLASLNTAVGIGLFILLWAMTFWSTRRGLRRLKQSAGGVGILSEAGGKLGDALGAAILWGGVNGLLFFAGLVLYTIVFVILPSTAAAPVAIGVLLIYTLAGGVIAFIVGAVSGLVFGLVGGILVSLARVIGD